MAPRPVLALGAAAALGAAWWHQQPGLGARYGPQEALVCAARAACEPDWRTFFYPMDDRELDGFPWAHHTDDQRFKNLEQMSRRCAEVNAAGSVPIILHVGANNMKKEFEVYQYMLKALKAPHQLVLVEPNTKVIPDLERRAASLGDIGGHAPKVINAAVCPPGWKGLSLYVPIADKILDDYPFHRLLSRLGVINVASLSEVASLDYDHTVTALKLNHHIPEIREEYIERVPIRCATPADLLAEVKASSAEVAYLAVDTEGFDAELVPLFFDLPDFRPPVMMFEWAGHHKNSTDKVDALARLVKTLHGRGYELRKEYENLVGKQA